MLIMRAFILATTLPLGLAMLLLFSGCPQREPAADESLPAVTPLGSPQAAAGAEAHTKPVVPPEWPQDTLPMYPDAELTASNYNLGGPEAGCVLNLSTTEDGESVLKFYQEHALAAGYEQQSYVAASDSGAAYFTSEEQSFNAGYRLEDGQTLITLMLIKSVPEDMPVAFAGSGQLPPNFPSDVLPLFPDATVLNAENLPMDNFLDLHTDAKLKEVLKFYKAFYAENGFKVLVDEQKKDYVHYVFEHEAGGVVLNLNTEPDDTTSIHLIYGRR